MSLKIIKDISFELEELESLFDLYRKELLEANHVPDLIELTALASVFHSFYTGIEKIFLIIAKNVDKNLPHDVNWHKSLLFQMAKENENRKAVISDKTMDDLSKYLVFRHFYRHSYSFRLKWGEIQKLVIPIQQVWDTFKTEISTFLKTLEKKATL